MSVKDKPKGKADKRPSNTPTISNRKARHEYHILESLEAGISLKGSEVKSVREGKAQLHESYVRILDGEAWLIGCHITQYKNQNTFEVYNPSRDRKLLMRKKQIEKLSAQVKEKGMTLLPLKIYFTRGKAKLEVGLGKGKKLYDKREDIKERDAKREMNRALKGH